MGDHVSLVFRGKVGAVHYSLPEFAEKMGLERNSLSTGSQVLFSSSFPLMSSEKNEGSTPGHFFILL